MKKHGQALIRVPSNKVKGQVDEVLVEVFLDGHMLAQLAHRAAMNRGGKAVIGSGAVVAKVKKREAVG